MKVKIVETVLRDAHQSLLATRMRTEDMIPALEMLDNIGYESLEMWGGATFDSCLRYLDEDPWERLKEIRKRIKNTKLQMLLRGQNILGYHHYSDDVLSEFIKRSVDGGIDIIRIFDALNDFRNIELAIKETKKAGGHAQGAISYTISPVHTTDTFVKLAKDLKDLGADSICIKDMSGLLKPYVAYELVKSIKEEVDLPVDVHAHMTSGLASMTYIKAIEAGADIVDTAISPLSMGTSQPSTESLVETLKGTEYDTQLNSDLLIEVSDHFRKLRNRYVEEGLINHNVLGVNIKTLWYQVPGGMMSNLISQLSHQNAQSKLQDVLEEVPRVREDLGYPPLVTPTSQIVGTQAVLNVLTGERYKMVPQEVKNYLKGMYGKPTVPIDEKFIDKILGSESREFTKDEKTFNDYKKEMAEFYTKPEDVLSYALFPQVATKFFENRQAKSLKLDNELLNREEKVYPV